MRIQFNTASTRRLLSLLLAFTLLLSNFPVISFAEESDPDEGTICGIAAHSHTEECNELVERLICKLEEGSVHEHSDSCYQEESVLTCTLEEQPAHFHTEECFGEESVLNCGQEQTEGHSHNNDCYDLQTKCVCTLDTENPHVHGDACSTQVSTLTCTKQEHEHNYKCYPALTSTGDASDISSYTSDLIIYNYLHRSNSDQTGTVSNPFVLKGTLGHDHDYGILVGYSDKSDPENQFKKPMAEDIKIELNGLEVKGATTINMVYPENVNYKTIIDVTEDSSFNTMKIADNATLEITLNANLTISSLEMGENSSLTVDTKGHTLTLNVAEGNCNGNVSIVSTSGTIQSETLSAQNLTITGGTVTANSIHAYSELTLSNTNISTTGNITADSKIKATNTAISGAALFGAADNATGTVTMDFRTTTFNGVTRIGAADGCNALVHFAPQSNAPNTTSTFVRDYTIQYNVSGVTEPSHYRVMSTTLAGETTLVGDTTLPTYAPEGYTYVGWKTAESADTFITNLEGQNSNLILYPYIQAKDVNVVLDLGFVPSADNCDNADSWLAQFPTISNGTATSSQNHALDSTIPLPAPERFGYVFKGWQRGDQEIITGSNYTVALNELTSTTPYTLSLTAVWEVASFPLYFSFASDVPMENIAISLDGKTWMTPAKLATDYPKYWRLEDSILYPQKDAYIRYGESLNDYFGRLGPKDSEGNPTWQMIRIKDTRFEINDPDAVEFTAWKTNKGIAVDGESTYDLSSTGYLIYAKEADTTWREFQTTVLINTGYIVLKPETDTAKYNLTLPTNSGWTCLVSYGDTVEEYTSGVVSVPNGAKVSFRRAFTSTLTISMLEFKSRLHFKVTERYSDAERNYVYYDFVMPACEVTTIFNATPGEKYVNIANGAITFETDFVNPDSGLAYFGFWTPQRLESGKTEAHKLDLLGMTPLYQRGNEYFYVWDNNQKLYVTSDGVPTTNQLTLADDAPTITTGNTTEARQNIYLRAINMVARNAYLNHAVGRRMYGISVETPRDTLAADKQGSTQNALNALDTKLSEMGNIVIPANYQDNGTASKYFLYFIGEDNRVGAIMSDRYEMTNGGDYVYIYGNASTTPSLTLGTVFASAHISAQYMKIKQYEGTNCAYMFHVIAAEQQLQINQCTITAPDKEFYCKDYKMIIQGNSNVLVGTLVAGQRLEIRKNANVRVRGNVYMGFSDLDLQANAVLVVDGDFLTKYLHWNNISSTGADGAVMIVKGSICEMGNRIWTAGTLICNTFVIGRRGGVTGGTVIANQMTNKVTQDWEVAYESTEYTWGNKMNRIEPVTANGDTYPYTTYSQKTDAQEKFIIGEAAEVYLLGDPVQVGTYNLNRTAMDTSLAQILGLVLDDNGNYVAPADPTAFKAAVMTQLQGNTNSAECIVIGNSTYNNDTRRRTVEISGNAKLYTSGNVTLFNDTVVKDTATVWCGGTFGSKLDLTIESGNVTATEIGIAYDLQTTLEDGTVRWKKLTVGSAATVNADRIGTLSTCVSDNSKQIYGTASIDTTALPGTYVLEYDSQINYLLGTSGFTNPEENLALTSIHVIKTVTNGVAAYTSGTATFKPPVFNDTEGAWAVGSSQGDIVTGVASNGKLCNGEEETDSAIYDSDRLVLVAVKGEYNVIVNSGENYITELNGQTESLTLCGAAPGSTVTIKLSDATIASDYTLVWYTDSNGYLRNPGYSAENGIVTFTMPYNDVEIYIAPEDVRLDLARNHVTITPDGFKTTFENDPTRTFRYKGNLTIYQSTFNQGKAGRILNRIQVLENVNNIGTNRKFTLHNINQYDFVDDIGLQLFDHVGAHFQIKGEVTLCRIEVPEHSEIILQGVDPNPANNKLDIHDADDVQGPDNRVGLGMNTGKAGNMTLENLKLFREGEGSNSHHFAYLGYSKDYNANAVVTYRNCELETKVIWYNNSSLGVNVGEVILEKCKFTFKGTSIYTGFLFSFCTDVKINNSTIRFEDVGASEANGSFTLFNNTQRVTITESNIEWNLINSSDSKTYRSYVGVVPEEVIMINSTYKGPEHDRFNALTIKGSTKMTIGAKGNGYLFASDLNISENAHLKAKEVVVSGYYNHVSTVNPSSHQVKSETLALQTKGDILGNLSSANPTIQTNGRLNMTSGTLEADSVGGDVHSEINVSGGTMTARRIGTLGALYGYGRNHPKAGEEWVYTYAKIPEGAIVNVSGTAEVNVTGYLGGMNATVNISGGTVNLDDSAILGMTDAQAATLKAHYDSLGQNINSDTLNNIDVNITGGEVLGDAGTINVPYGDLSVSGQNTGVKVNKILAQYGRIEIRQADNQYDQPNPQYSKVGVYVIDELNGQTILITDSASVYANKAIATALLQGDTASLTVKDGKVYADIVGTDGAGNAIVDSTEGSIIHTSKQVSIQYVLNGDATDVVENDNPNSYTYKHGEIINLKDPVRHRYQFMGWYETAEQAQTMNPNERIYRFEAQEETVVLHAAWVPKTVTFEIYVEQSSFSTVDLAAEAAKLGDSVIYDSEFKVLTFKQTVSVPYRQLILGTGEQSINLSDFSLADYTSDAIVFPSDMPNGGAVQFSTVVTAEIFDYFVRLNASDPDKIIPIKLKVSNLVKKNATVTLHLDQKDGRPVDAVFYTDKDYKENILQGHAVIGGTLYSATELLAYGTLIKPYAPGYTFAGWYTKSTPSAEDPAITHEYTVTGTTTLDLYAEWAPNSYPIEFDATRGGVITTGEQQPENDVTQPLKARVFYDTKIDGGIYYVENGEAAGLPTAWKPGYRFLYWAVDQTKITDQELNKTTFPSMDLNNTYVALTLTAVYEPLSVTYHTGGGKFTADMMSKLEECGTDTYIGYTGKAMEYGNALAGYVKNPYQNPNYELKGKQTIDNNTYSVLSTTAKYYKDYGYYTGDYREDLVRKGYTFQGWKDQDGNFIGTQPAYEDIELWAVWTANTYSLTLHATEDDQSNESEYSAIKETGDLPVTGIYVTVDQVIGEHENWPNRNTWYAESKGQYTTADKKQDARFIMGFTFNFFEPGAPYKTDESSEASDAYTHYASTVTALINHGVLFTKTETISGKTTNGSVFRLPEYQDYNEGLFSKPGVTPVPDYPDGSDIDLFAVYRERSLVFIERYVDTDGKAHEKELYAASYSEYSDYPTRVYEQNTDLINSFKQNGYYLAYWSVNTPEGGTKYNEVNYTANHEQWQKDANQLGCYDINVYTFYAARVEAPLQLVTSTDRTATHATVQEYSVPGSMINKVMVYSIQNVSDNLNLVSLDELEQKRYSPESVGDVAIHVDLVDPNGKKQGGFWLDEDDDPMQKLNIGVGAGWKLRFTMYHSRVIPNNCANRSFEMLIQFEGDNENGLDSYQQILLKADIIMKGVLWDVQYQANLPTEIQHLTIENKKDFTISDSSPVAIYEIPNWVYGNYLHNQVPVVEGYTWNGKWKQDEEELDGMPVISNTDAIVLTADYTRNSYTLTDSTNGKCTVTKTGSVLYQEAVTLIPQTDPAFIWLKDKDNNRYRLDQLTKVAPYFTSEENGVYTILMPAGNITLEYDDVMELYLGVDTISIFSDHYEYNSESVRWSGNYKILQWPADREFEQTGNVLNLSGNLQNRTITLGKLDITKGNSIALSSGTEANLVVEDSITAKNILVPSSATLNLSAKSTTKVNVTLTPDSGYAAIGGHNDSAGNIWLDNLNLTLNLPSGSTASGIGTGLENGTNGNITITNCSILTHEETSMLHGAYKGTWVGGNNSANVSIQNTTIRNTDGTSNTYANLVDGGMVTLENCEIGTSEEPIHYHPIHGDNVYVKGSEIYIDSNETVLSPTTAMYVGENSDGDGSVIHVTGNAVTPYFGKLILNSAKSDVIISGCRYLELGNGDVEIQADKSIQNAVSLNHSGDYRLINYTEATTSNLTTTGNRNNLTIFTDVDCQIGTLTVNANTSMKFFDDVTVNSVSIESGKTLHVETNEHTFRVKGYFSGEDYVEANFGGEGHYIQTEGTMESEVDVVVGGNMTLIGTKVIAESKKVGSNGSSGAVTTVSIKNSKSVNSEVKASHIGAIGAQNETFTYVELEGNPIIDGTLQQDLFRLNYHLEDTNFAKSEDGIPLDKDDKPLPTVLRSVTEAPVTEEAVVTYYPEVPNEPKYVPASESVQDGESYFDCWYMKDGETKLPLSKTAVDGFDRVYKLDDSWEKLTTANDDGTGTLDLYNWMKVIGTGKIVHGRELNAVTTGDSSVSIETNGAWTAWFDVYGTATEDAIYQFNFQSPIPANTKMTLSVWRNGTVSYYYYIPETDVDSIQETDFRRMGSEDSMADLISGTDYIDDMLQLSADFANATETATATEKVVTLNMNLSGTSYSIAEVSYTVHASVDASVTASYDSTESTVTYHVTPGEDVRYNAQRLYLTAVLKRNNEPFIAPYDAQLTLGGTSGMWLGGNMVCFDLGSYRPISETTNSWSLTGLEEGSYTVEWYLTTASAAPNIFGNVLAHSQKTGFSVERTVQPSLSVTLKELTGTHVLTAGKDHTIRFSYVTNGNVTVQVEKQDSLQFFRSVSTAVTVDQQNISVTIPAEAGVYRIRFSLDGFEPTSSSNWDDVYYTFIVK